MTDKLIFRHRAENSNVRIVRVWEKIGPNTVREISTEIGYNFSNEQWEVTHEFTRTLEITDSGLLIGDGSNWDGEGMLWREYAEKRHNELLSCRLPYECGDREQTPRTKEVAKELIQANY